jgi:hypothetical protein
MGYVLSELGVDPFHACRQAFCCSETSCTAPFMPSSLGLNVCVEVVKVLQVFPAPSLPEKRDIGVNTT